MSSLNRRVTIAEVFILSLVQQGLSSSFELNRLAGVSLGTSLPVLKRLSSSGLLKSSEPGSRRKVKYVLTAVGERALGTFVQQILGTEKSILDGDSALRAMFIAEWHGRSKLVPQIAENAARQLERAARFKETASEERGQVEISKAVRYRTLRSLLDTARLRAEAKELRAIGRRGLRQGRATAQAGGRPAPQHP